MITPHKILKYLNSRSDIIEEVPMNTTYLCTDSFHTNYKWTNIDFKSTTSDKLVAGFVINCHVFKKTGELYISMESMEKYTKVSIKDIKSKSFDVITDKIDKAIDRLYNKVIPILTEKYYKAELEEYSSYVGTALIGCNLSNANKPISDTTVHRLAHLVIVDEIRDISDLLATISTLSGEDLKTLTRNFEDIYNLNKIK